MGLQRYLEQRREAQALKERRKKKDIIPARGYMRDELLKKNPIITINHPDGSPKAEITVRKDDDGDLVRKVKYFKKDGEEPEFTLVADRVENYFLKNKSDALMIKPLGGQIVRHGRNGMAMAETVNPSDLNYTEAVSILNTIDNPDAYFAIETRGFSPIGKVLDKTTIFKVGEKTEELATIKKQLLERIQNMRPGEPRTNAWDEYDSTAYAPGVVYSGHSKEEKEKDMALDPLTEKPSNSIENSKTLKDFDDEESYVSYLVEQVDPTDQLSTLNFGAHAASKLAEIARTVRIETKEDSSLIARLEALPKAIKEGDLKKLQQTVADYHLATKKGTHWVKRQFNTVRGFTESNLRKKMEGQVQLSVDAIDIVVADLNGIKDKLPNHIERTKDLARAIVDNQIEVDLHMQALNRVIETLEETTIPETEKRIKDNLEGSTTSTQDEYELMNFTHNVLPMLQRKRESFAASKAITNMVIEQIKSQENVYSVIYMKTQDHLTHSRAMWEMQGAAAQGTVLTSRMLGGIETADELSGDLLESGTQLTMVAMEDAKRAGGKSLIDPEKVVKALSHFGQKIEESNSEIIKLTADFKDRADRILVAADSFEEKAKKVAPIQKKNLESH